MNKIKEIISITTLIILAVLIIIVCNHNNEIEINNSNNTEQLISDITSSTKVSEIQTNSNLITLLNLDYLKLPIEKSEHINYKIVSHIEDEEQRYSGDITYSDYYSYEYHDAFFKNNNVHKVLAKDYYDESSTGYDNLTEEFVIAKYTGDWDAICGKIKYINYFENNEKPEQMWIDYFKSKLEGAEENIPPIIIKEAWLFEHNGMKCAAVNATNFVYTNEYDTNMSLPINESNLIYSLSAIFINDKIYDMDCNSMFTVYNTSLSEINGTVYSLTTPGHYGDDDFGIFIGKCFQYNNTGEITLFSAFSNCQWLGKHDMVSCTPKFAILDIDGDSDVEIIYHFIGPNSNMNITHIYDLQELH